MESLPYQISSVPCRCFRKPRIGTVNPKVGKLEAKYWPELPPDAHSLRSHWNLYNLHSSKQILIQNTVWFLFHICCSKLIGSLFVYSIFFIPLQGWLFQDQNYGIFYDKRANRMQLSSVPTLHTIYSASQQDKCKQKSPLFKPHTLWPICHGFKEVPIFYLFYKFISCPSPPI